jgi:hypothetical protein
MTMNKTTVPAALLCSLVLALWLAVEEIAPAAEPELPANRWVQIQKDPIGARRGSALRYAPDAGRFFLWGFMNHDYELLQESVTMPVPEHDMVALDPADGKWRGHFPKAYEADWSKKPPAVFIPRTYSGITSGSERSLFRPPEGFPAETARPDLNIVFDHVAYHPSSKSLVYFTGGLTLAYNVIDRKWTNLAPAHSPPPVLGGSLAHDPVHDEIVLTGGGMVAEEGPGGRLVGYASTWLYSFKNKDWRRLEGEGEQPPPRMNSRAVTDTKNQLLVLFGGDGHSHYLADTWLYELKTRRWRQAKPPGGPPARAGHFTVFDPETGWVLIGGGYNRADLNDMWAYDAAQDRWRKLTGDVPAGFYLSADLAPEKRLLILTTNTKTPGDGHRCNELYPVRSTYAYRIDKATIVDSDAAVKPQTAMPKMPEGQSGRNDKPDPERQKAQAERLRTLPVNQWVALANPARVATTRSWGSATIDTDRGRILYWGGGHCGYGGSDVDSYDIDQHTWQASTETPDYPHRQWNLGVRLAGVTFGGNPWTVHGRKIYAYDTVSRKMVMVRPIHLMTGYVPDKLRDFPGEPRAHEGAKVKTPTWYWKYATWLFDPDTGRFDIVGPAPVGVDALVTTKHGVMGVNVDWPNRDDDAGYNRPWAPGQPNEDTALLALDSARKTWKRLGDKQPSPQNLYEQTSLAYDSQRDQVLLHGGGAKRDELWAFDLKTNQWKDLKPKVAAPAGAAPPICNRESVYIASQDVMLTYGPAPDKRSAAALWAYKPGDNTWNRIDVAAPPGIDPRVAAGQNRALAYDPKRDIVLLVLGTHGDQGKTQVFALRYRHDQAKLVK